MSMSLVAKAPMALPKMCETGAKYFYNLYVHKNAPSEKYSIHYGLHDSGVFGS